MTTTDQHIDSGGYHAPEPEPREGPLHRPANTSDDRSVVSFSAAAVYETVRVEGVHEMLRPPTSLWWSGVAAGLAMAFSVLCPVYLELGGASPLVASLGYSVGFVLVVLGRLQLFTENTITTVLPLLSEPSRRGLLLTARLWAVVLFANVVGGGLAAGVTLFSGLLEPPQATALLKTCHHAIAGSAAHNFVRAMPAGFLIAGVVWLTRANETQQFLVVVLLTYVMKIGHFGHVIAGSIEAWFVILGDGHSAMSAMTKFFVPTLGGNIVGGTGLFALLSYGQVWRELDDSDAA